jgi:hypothetical protein
MEGGETVFARRSGVGRGCMNCTKMNRKIGG